MVRAAGRRRAEEVSGRRLRAAEDIESMLVLCGFVDAIERPVETTG